MKKSNLSITKEQALKRIQELEAKLFDMEPLQPGHIQIPLTKILTLVHNMMDPRADKTVGPELLAEYVGNFTQQDVDDFVMGVVRKLPGYSLADGLRIAENLTRWRNSFFDNAFESVRS